MKTTRKMMNALEWLIISFQLTLPLLLVAIVDFIFHKATHIVALAAHIKIAQIRKPMCLRKSFEVAT